MLRLNEATVECGHCKGTGRMELTGEYLTTFIELAKLGGEATGAELGRTMGVKGPAMNNRLAILEKHGLLQSRRWGRKRLYKVSPCS